MNLSFQNKLKENLRKYPNNIALEYGEERLTFLQLDQKTDWIASRIIAAGVKKSRFIGIYTDDKSRFILAMIGILKAGCVFVPLEPMIPWKRTETMLRTTNTCIVFTDGQYQQQFDVLCRTFIIDESCFRIEASLATETQVEYDPEGPVYVYFTSGSTGTPKAILGKSKSLLHFIEWEIDTFCINESFRVSQLTNPLFDVLLRDVFVPLFSGGCVCIPGNREILVNRDELVNWIDDSRVHLIHCVPAVFRVFNAENLTPENFRQLKYILMSGERIPPYDLSKWYAVFDERIQLVNLYGPTETTMIKTYYFIQKNDVQKSRIPVGKPMRGCRIIILDKNMTPCGKEIVGEIYIRTPYMTLGYYNEEELNKKYFIPNPFNNDPNDLFYKTGDLGKILPDGNIDLIGRSDRQVKIRGIRVELEEIENVILKSTLVQEVVIVDIEH
ncbi:MAG: amino acid adenylation domain-containing protein, partial [Acidobacteria bacterium]|nr:amino acid adenylation domain-containing protein [Acidobacteriota bacterium]